VVASVRVGMVARLPQALNRLISPVLARGTVVSSSPCWPMIRKVVLSSSAVTILPAWGKPTWMRWRATWMPPRLETFRWTVWAVAGVVLARRGGRPGACATGLAGPGRAECATRRRSGW
jgi:hypothetical protein